ncbi:type III polyketide synthase [Kineococcus sp. R8]|uniref:type III polyketide synthase n=1 Tax=Kineococcus siccus TaxID=2696567 RepID=UPI001413723F|nr:type III polyketide synthase [Kineococcus siccus]
MSRIVAVEPVLPPHTYDQADITAELAPLLTHDSGRRAVMERVHANAGVATRHLALPLERYRTLDSFQASNDAFVRVALGLAERALTGALARARLLPTDVDFVLFTSVTGISAPSVDALLVARSGLRPDVKRLPTFGLGCVAGAAGLARVHDYLEGHPDEVGVLISVELCSLTVQRDDDSVPNLVASGLFGDGASAVVLLGDARARRTHAAGWDVQATRSRIYPDTAGALGWDVGGTGFRIVLSAALPDIIAAHLGEDVDRFLAAHGTSAAQVPTWIAHAGGPKVLQAVAAALDLPAGALEGSWRSLRDVGNLSSSSVLHVLAAATPAAHGERAVVVALGPGVSQELLLLQHVEEAAA